MEARLLQSSQLQGALQAAPQLGAVEGTAPKLLQLVGAGGPCDVFILSGVARDARFETLMTGACLSHRPRYSACDT